MKALILAGGFATRLRPLSCTRPKCIFPILNKPLIEWTYENLAQHHVDDVILAINHQTATIIKQNKIPRHGLNITFSYDPLRKPLGSGGPIKKAREFIGDKSPFIVLNGDIYTDVDYTEILKLHRQSNAIATIALTKVKNPSRYGVAQLAENNQITKFIEKPSKGIAPTNLINAGIYILDPEIYSYIAPNRSVSIEREVFTSLAQEKKLYGYIHKGTWIDIGKPEDYLSLHKNLLNQQQSKTTKKTGTNNPVTFDDHVSIGDKSEIGPYVVLGRNVMIGAQVKIRDSIVFRDTIIDDLSIIERAIIGEACQIGRNVRIGKKCVIGDYVRIADNVKLGNQVMVCPAKEIRKSIGNRRYVI